MSEQQTGRRHHYQDAPMPPPVSGRQYSSQLSDYGTRALQRPASNPSNHHRVRGRQGPSVWPWVFILGMTIVGGLASLIVLDAGNPPTDQARTVEPAEIAVDDLGATSTARIASERVPVTNTTNEVPGPTAESSGDPFERYLELVAEWDVTDAPELSRDDAQTRAILGCSSVWPAATVDAALAEAYDEFLRPYREQGLCG